MSSTTRIPKAEITGPSAARGNIAMGIESQEFSKACALPLAQLSSGYATSA